VHLERNEPERALAILDRVRQSSDAGLRLTLRSLVTLRRARVARLLGDLAGADALLAQTRLFYAEPDKSVLQVFGEEAVAQALQFDQSKAAELIAELDQDSVETQLLRVRLALLEGDGRTAAAVLAALPPPATRRMRVERNVLSGLSELERNVERANGYVREALTAGQPERLVRTFVDCGRDVHKLLLSCTPDAREEPYLRELISAAGQLVAPARAVVTTPLVESLSARELTVLRYLCSRLTYREIAAALYVSLNTLKSHVRSVYRKLGVESRADAVDVGRRLGVI
jgi:LuxR family transcriptional regulator, maltose regulon positive regulatory protein